MAKLSLDVVTMGSATQDVFAKTDAETIKICQHQLCETLLAYPLGGKILVKEIDFQIGGGGTNTATTFARQELKTGWIGKIGKDPAGLSVTKFLKEENITYLGGVGNQTGFSIILDSEAEDRTILTFKGANDELSLKDIEKALDGLEMRWLYCSSMLGESFETMKAVMHHTKSCNGKIAFNPSDYQAKQGREVLKDVLFMLDVIMLNKEEAQLLTGLKVNDIKKLLIALHGTGPNICVVTDGPNGVSCLAEGKIFHVEPLPERTIAETTGAGDAFGSAFIAGLAREKTMREALLLGILNAESVIAHYGAKNQILNRLEADILVGQDKREITEEPL
ncbi:carbohydrate kinase family protein [Candidatus Woesearchaeota archaeon]|nr:carbohydrate kinase family protein [Candidatus Woesearchaeota archaeon]